MAFKLLLEVKKFWDILSNFKGTHLAKPAASTSLQHVNSSWVELTDAGTFTDPSSAASAETERTGLCIRPNNFWDRDSSSKYIFMNLMGKLLRMIPLFNKNTLEKIFKTKQNVGSTFKLLPPAPLVQLKNLIKQFTDPNVWHSGQACQSC